MNYLDRTIDPFILAVSQHSFWIQMRELKYSVKLSSEIIDNNDKFKNNFTDNLHLSEINLFEDNYFDSDFCPSMDLSFLRINYL